MANLTGLDFPQISVGQLADGPAAADGTAAGYSVLTVTVQLRGDWVDVIEYHHRINKLDRGVRVTNTTLAYVPETEDSKAAVQATIVLEVYVMAPAASATQATPAEAPAEAPASP
jgi:hypothetical protein